MTPACTETVLNFHCQGEHLLGIVSAPGAHLPAKDTAVVIVVGGPQYRIGSHRQFVLLARSLALAGFICLRFDYRGMGDSAGAVRDFQAVTPDIGAAIDALMSAQPQLKNVVLWGLCDGASASLLYCDDTMDARISGVAALNPWVRSAASLARTHVKHYYLQRLRQPEFWRKLFSGQLGLSAIGGLSTSIKTASRSASTGSTGRQAQQAYQDRMANACFGHHRKILLILSGDDYTAKEFIEVCKSSPPWRNLLEASHLQRHDLAEADHTFSDILASRQVADITSKWLDSLTLQSKKKCIV